MNRWTETDIPNQNGRFVIVTGATSGLGYETARALAAKGAEVVLAVRNLSKGRDTVQRIQSLTKGAKVEVELLDLASLNSVAEFCNRMIHRDRPIDILVNNAGVMAVPNRQTTQDGFELQFGTNHLGHFALTGQLLPLIQKASAPRVVSVSSIVHRYGKINFDDLQSQGRYGPMKVYGQSKLAVLQFALELQRRSDRHGWGILSCAAHPGFARTGLQTAGPNLGKPEGAKSRDGYALISFLSQDAASGALPSLYGATSPNAQGGAYYGPSGGFELKGTPVPAKLSRRARDEKTASELWNVSERLTGVKF
ncbi:SDR family oxidoreductase [Alicyclobacillus ferrooxydans]|uniref:Short-chain dehydrogenase n=1 Tax=Alicyclobacillus ferrooxydans TaxID=471514 RepID=A0A0P9CTD0_9BACL|nr:SDR family oxidoreductase [Alicyclobacillus ferrooxydans]KPV42904.1 short-chain dehydrogenase [Alicyclobacillus ferrooxydans]